MLYFSFESLADVSVFRRQRDFIFVEGRSALVIQGRWRLTFLSPENVLVLWRRGRSRSL